MELLQEAVQAYVHPEFLILVPVLYGLGMIFKKAAFVADRWIPLLLCGISMGLCILYEAAVAEAGSSFPMVLFTAMTQGILVAGASVFCHQLVKQLTSDTEA